MQCVAMTTDLPVMVTSATDRLMCDLSVQQHPNHRLVCVLLEVNLTNTDNIDWGCQTFQFFLPQVILERNFVIFIFKVAVICKFPDSLIQIYLTWERYWLACDRYSSSAQQHSGHAVCHHSERSLSVSKQIYALQLFTYFINKILATLTHKTSLRYMVQASTTIYNNILNCNLHDLCTSLHVNETVSSYVIKVITVDNKLTVAS